MVKINTLKRVACGALALVLAVLLVKPTFARQIEIEENTESMIMLDVARRYYPVAEIKKYIDALSAHENSTLQLHFTDDENVGIECDYLDQTVENATFADDIYTNPTTGRPFLSYAQVQDLMDYADEKNVRFVPEIDIPAHMKGFFDLAEDKFGYDYVHEWRVGIGWAGGDEVGHLDFLTEKGAAFWKSIYDEYTDFFSSREYFHMGFDEYTLRNDEKIDFANEVYGYLAEKGFKVRMWSDALTEANLNRLNKDIELVYWGWWDDVAIDGYASVPSLQEAGFKMLITNRWYLFSVPSTANMTEENRAHSIRDIEENWELEKWNYNFPSTLENHDGIMGGAVCVWGENSAGVSDAEIREHTIAMYEAMLPKLDKIRRVIEIPDEEPATTEEPVVEEESKNETKPEQSEEAENPDTSDLGLGTVSVLFACLGTISIAILRRR